MGKFISIQWKDEEVVSYVDRVKRRLGRPKRFLNWCAYTMRKSILRNFEVGGRPRHWQKLAALTIQLRIEEGTWGRSQPILQAKGTLAASIGSLKKVTTRRLEYGTIDPRSGILQLGGSVRVFGRGVGVIPPRPFVVVQTEDADVIVKELDAHMFLEKTLMIGS